jgi:hypothetical protein
VNVIGSHTWAEHRGLAHFLLAQLFLANGDRNEEQLGQDIAGSNMITSKRPERSWRATSRR